MISIWRSGLQWRLLEIEEEMNEFEREVIYQKQEELGKATETLTDEVGTTDQGVAKVSSPSLSLPDSHYSFPTYSLKQLAFYFLVSFFFLKAFETFLLHNKERLADALPYRSTMLLASTCSSFLKLLAPVVSFALPLFFLYLLLFIILYSSSAVISVIDF